MITSVVLTASLWMTFFYILCTGWCNFDHPVAEIEPFKTVSPSAVETFNFLSKHRKLPPNVSPPAFVSDRFKLPIFQKRPVKLAFSLIVHTDFPLLLRMFNHIYDPYHYYLIHMDPFNSNEVFVNKVIDTLIYPNLPNVFLSRDVSMVCFWTVLDVLLCCVVVCELCVSS